MKKDFKNGFTLIELVIIMVILGVLAAVAIPRIGNTIDSSEVSAEEAVIGSLRSALEVYAMDQVVMKAELRMAKGLTQQALSDSAEVSRKSINAIENGIYVPSTVLALKIAKTLGCSVEDVFRLPE